MLLKNLLRILVSGLLLAGLAWRMDWGQVAGVFAQLRLELWLAAVAVFLLTQFVSAARWHILATPLGLGRPFWQFAGFYFIGMYFNLVLPTSVGGDVVRAWYLDRHTGRRRTAFLSVLIDRLSGLVVLIALAAAATLLSPVPLPAWIPLGVAAAAAGVGAGLLLLPYLARRRLLGDKFAALAGELRASLPALLRPAPVALSVVVQAANVLLVWLLGLGIGLKVPGGYYWILVPMVSLLTLIPVSINGMGVREAATVLFLSHLGVAEGAAVSLSVLWFSVFSVASLVGGVVYVYGRFPRPEVAADHGPLGYHSDQGRTGQSRAAA